MRLQDIVPSKLVFHNAGGGLFMTFNGLQPADITSSELLLELNQHVYTLLTQTENQKLVVNLSGEGISEAFLMASPMLKGLMENYSIPISNILIQCGAAPIEDNILKYIDHCKTFNAIPFNIQFQNSYEHQAAHAFLSTKLEFYDAFDSTPRLKQKVFLSFNNSPRLHRLYLASELIRRNLINRAFVSMNLNYSNLDSDSYLTYLLHGLKLFFPKNHDRVYDILQSNKDLFPMILNFHMGDATPMDIVNDTNYFNESYFSLVTETKFLRDLPGMHDTQLDCYLFSEKTYKPILAKHPFILMSRPGSLAVLRHAGYKTFHPYIDESYDDITDDEDRIEAIINEVERLSKFTDEEWLAWQSDIRHIVDHNFNNLKDFKLVTLQSKDYLPS